MNLKMELDRKRVWVDYFKVSISKDFVFALVAQVMIRTKESET